MLLVCDIARVCSSNQKVFSIAQHFVGIRVRQQLNALSVHNPHTTLWEPLANVLLLFICTIASRMKRELRQLWANNCSQLKG